jgi:hypothetical protein
MYGCFRIGDEVIKDLEQKIKKHLIIISPCISLKKEALMIGEQNQVSCYLKQFYLILLIVMPKRI